MEESNTHHVYRSNALFLNFPTLTSAKQEETLADPTLAPSAAKRPTREASKYHLATRSVHWSGVSPFGLFPRSNQR